MEEPVTVFDRKGKRPIVRFRAVMPDGRRLTFAFPIVDLVCACAESEAEMRGQMFVKGMGFCNVHTVIRKPVKQLAVRTK